MQFIGHTQWVGRPNPCGLNCVRMLKEDVRHRETSQEEVASLTLYTNRVVLLILFIRANQFAFTPQLHDCGMVLENSP